ncbi:MAG: protein kinase [Deltaproteobacteria bacterium]|nr:protein kinase [Deltaproteobacteria bacterium]
MLDQLSQAQSDPAMRDLGFIAAMSLVLLFLVLRFTARPGDVSVSLEYPSELRGTFSVHLSKKKGKRKRLRAGRKRTEKSSTKTEHYLVSRETQFRGVAARRYWITVDGVLNDPTSRSVLKTVCEERQVLVKRGKTVRLEYDFWPEGCPVEVSVLWDNRPAREASVSLMGRPSSLRYVRGGSARLELPMGSQRIVVGSGDRVAEVELDVVNHRPISLSVDLGMSEFIIFKGCPLAVEPYLQGNMSVAARELEREGQIELANLLLARLHESSGQTQAAADHFETAGCFTEAAQLFESLSNPQRAAELYLRSGDQENRCKAISLLVEVDSGDVAYANACQLLARGYDLEGQPDKSIDKMEEMLTLVEDPLGTEDVHSRLAELLEQRGDEERAIEVLEKLQTFCDSYPNVATRLESLRKQVSVEKNIASQTTGPQRDTMIMGSSPAMVESGSRYDIVEQIGRGGMGVVFKARDRRLWRHVAIKQLPEELREHDTAVQLFLSEARSVAVLNHPNIVTLYDADQEGEKYFITMELLEGKPLSRILRKHGRFSPRDCARLGLQVAAGLHYAHSKRIVHRDIKMGNLFYTKEKVVKIMDFGIAKVMEEVRKGSTVMGGTPNYMSPEQTLGKSVDIRTDIYAFGVTLFEMLTGKLPFTDGDVAYHHCHTRPPDPCELVPEIPQGFAELVLHMLVKDPEERIATAALVSAQLKKFAS